MVKDLYQKSFSVLMKRPFRLWGLSLLAGVLLLAAQAGFIGVPAVAFCAALLLGGCAGPTAGKDDGRLRVVCTLFPYYDLSGPSAATGWSRICW